MSTVSIFAGLVKRTWRVGPRCLAVTLDHNTVTGTRVLYVDGGEVAGTEGISSVFSAQTILMFTADGWSGRVIIERSGTEVVYTCIVSQGAQEMTVQEDNAAAVGGAADLASKLQLRVETPEGGVTETGEPVVYYEVVCVREADGRGTRVHRRFRDFFALNDAVRSAYQGSQLLGSLPEPPPRGLKFLENHADPAFVEKRRWLLADFLYKLESVPRMRMNADFLAFVGLVGNTRETSVFFPEKSLGLSLNPSPDGTTSVLAALKPLADGKPSPAQARKLVNVGDKISKINGEDMFCVGSHAIVLAKLQSAPRPLLVHFVGPAAPALPAEVVPTAGRVVSSNTAAAVGGGGGAPSTSSTFFPSSSSSSSSAPAPTAAVSVSLEPPPVLFKEFQETKPGAPPPLKESASSFEDII